MRVTQIDPSRTELLLTFADSTDQIVLRYTSGWSGIDAVRFSDGTALSLDALRGLARATGTAPDDVLSGTSAAATFSAGAGDDVIVTGGGAGVKIGRAHV